MNDLDIIKIRKDLGKTQLEFAEFLGVDRRTVINYEQGKKIPSSKIKLLGILLSNVKGFPSEVKNTTNQRVSDASLESIESLKGEILDLKDHIKTLKDFLEEKNKLAEMYMNENKLLKERLVKLEID